MIPQAQKSQAIDILIDLFAKVTLLSFDVHSTTMSLKKKKHLTWITEASGEPSQMPENAEQLSSKLT